MKFIHFFQAQLLFVVTKSFQTKSVPKFRQFSNSLAQGLTMTKLDILTRDFELTPTIKEKVDAKIGKALSKFRLEYVSSHVTLRLHKFPDSETHSHTTKKDSQIAEITVNVKGGKTIHLSERSEDMYASIDLLSNKLQRMLSRYKEKFRGSKNHEEPEYVEEPESNDNFVATYSDVMDDKLAGKILKEKAFEMPAMSASEAAENLEFIDHPFYVFRNKETNEINVLYKRKEGGVGIIMPKK